MFKRRRKFTYSRTSPRGDRRGCLCPDGRTYSTKCCDGSLQAQGIGNITKAPSTTPDSYLLLEDDNNLLTESNDKIKL